MARLVGVLGGVLYLIDSTASWRNRFQELSSDSLDARSIRVTWLWLAAAASATAESALNSTHVSLGLASGSEVSWHPSRPNDTVRAASSRIAPGWLFQVVLPLIWLVSHSSTGDLEHDHAHVSNALKVASRMCLPRTAPTLKSQYIRFTCVRTHSEAAAALQRPTPSSPVKPR